MPLGCSLAEVEGHSADLAFHHLAAVFYAVHAVASHKQGTSQEAEGHVDIVLECVFIQEQCSRLSACSWCCDQQPMKCLGWADSCILIVSDTPS